jgi:hypothetical protein
MPGNLYFYVNFGTLIHEAEEASRYIKGKTRKKVRPSLRDIEWEVFYMLLEAKGFSGFLSDEAYTCFRDIHKVEKKFLKQKEKERLLKPNGELKEYVPVREYIRGTFDVRHHTPLYDNEAKNTMLFGSRGGGKAAPLSEPVLTDKGWETMGDIKEGTKVYGRDGRLTNVVKIHPQGKQRIWKVILQDGREVRCSGEHLWTVLKANRKEAILTTEEMYNNGLSYFTKRGNIHKYRIPNCNPVEFEEKELPIDPYILGCLLGDGTLTTKTPKIASSDDFIINTFREKLKGFEIKYDPSTTNNYTIVDRSKEEIEINDKRGRNYCAKLGNRLTRRIEELRLNVSCRKKFIPAIYKEASIEQRKELLRGLIDTDGTILKGGGAEFTNTCRTLIRDTAELCRSLGIRCQIGEDKREGQEHCIKGHKCKRGIYYRLYINTTKEIAKLPRKLELLKDKRYTLQQDFIPIVDIVKTNEFEEQQCITVDNEDHTYITKDYIVTHNSYIYSQGVALYDIVFSGTHYYNEEFIKNPNEVHVNIGSFKTDKSSDLCSKMETAMNEFAINPELGVWGEEGKDDYEPNPFYKNMRGSLRPNNNKNPWIHSYEKKVNGQWIDGYGTNSKVIHSNYKDNPESAAGGRYLDMIIEECGLQPNLITTHNSNEACTIITGKFGSQHYIGTSGNIEKVQEAKEMFTHPNEYEMLEYDDEWEGSGKIGFFLPAYLMREDYKDEHGNTDIEAAIKYFEERRELKKRSKNPLNYLGELMNYPMKPSEMFISNNHNMLPVEEAMEQLRKLEIETSYDFIGDKVKLYFDHEAPNGVSYKLDLNNELTPIHKFPWDPKLSREGCVMIYEYPQEIDGVVPQDAYIIGHDPVSSDSETGPSLAAIYVLKVNKYANKIGHNEIVASFVGRPYLGRHVYNEIMEQLSMFYGNATIFFEDSGTDTTTYFRKRKKLHLLAQRPETVLSKTAIGRRAIAYGYPMGNRKQKIEGLNYLRDWLLEERTDVEGNTVTNLAYIKDKALLQEIINFNIDEGNFDRILALVGCMIGLEETHNQYVNTENQKHKEDILDHFNKKLKERIGLRRSKSIRTMQSLLN